MLCELTYPTFTNCRELYQYLNTFITEVSEIPVVWYAVYDDSPTTDQLDSLWLPCDPPACAMVIWLNTDTEEYEIWSYVAGTWRNTGVAAADIAYYTDFNGAAGAIGDDWVGDLWQLDGNGNAINSLSYGVNLLDNPDFEDWTGSAPDSWVETGPTGATQVTSPIYNGQYSAEFAPVGAPPCNSVSQTVAVTEGLWYLFGGYGHTYQGGANGALISVGAWLDGSVQDGSDDWVRLEEYDFSITASAAVSVSSILCGIIGGGGGYADAIFLQAVTDGMYLMREFFSPYGELYLDFTLGTSGMVGLLLQYADASNFMFVAARDDKIYTVTVNAGSAVQVREDAYVYVDGGRLVVRVNSVGTTLDVDYNGGNIYSGQAVTFPGGSSHGIVMVSPDAQAHAFGYTPE